MPVLQVKVADRETAEHIVKRLEDVDRLMLKLRGMMADVSLRVIASYVPSSTLTRPCPSHLPIPKAIRSTCCLDGPQHPGPQNPRPEPKQQGSGAEKQSMDGPLVSDLCLEHSCHGRYSSW